jgi:hypothetical protein
VRRGILYDMTGVQIALAVLLPICVGCGTKQDDITGKWVGQQFMNYESSPDDVVDYRLEFRSDKSFVGTMKMSVMMVVDSKMSGTYTREGDVVTLTGNSETYMDDGYSKESNTLPYSLKLKVEKDRLTAIDFGDSLVILSFRREGTPKLNPPPKPAERPSEPAALALIELAKQTYAKIKTYSDDGTIKSDGSGFSAKDARFRIRYSNDGRFLYKAEHLSDGKVYETEGAAMNKGKAWLYMDEGSAERTIGNALGIVGTSSRYAATLVPSLLMPNDMGGSDFKHLKSFALLKDEKVDGRLCKVVEARTELRNAVRFWVDAETHLIRKTFDSSNQGTTTYNPKVNAAIPDREFSFIP